MVAARKMCIRDRPQGMLQAWVMSLVGLTVQSLVLALYATQERKEYRARSLTQTCLLYTSRCV